MNINKNDITYMMANDNYGVCYEPIVRISDTEIIGYEALSRFKIRDRLCPPDKVFKIIHDDIELFYFIETLLKKFQLKNRPKDKTLFLNIDPDVAVCPIHIESWVNFFKNAKDTVIEIIENSDEDNVEDVEHLMEWLDEYNLRYAYDDYGKANSMFFTTLFQRANVIKFDMGYLKIIKTDPLYIEVLKGSLKYAKAKNKMTILEGIETIEDLEIAKSIGIEYAQGYLYKKEFINKWKSD